MKFFNQILMMAFCLFITTFACSQSAITTLPRGSQNAVSQQTIGLTTISVDYHRPAVKEREIWGKMVAYNAPWRAGANENTIISFSTDVTIEGKTLKAGNYGFHIIPTEKNATLAFSTATSAWGSYSYNPKEDALRVTITPKKTMKHYEYLTFEFDDIKKEEVTCALKWGDKQFPFKVAVDLKNTVLVSLRNELRTRQGWTWMGWNEAANFCLQNNINHKEAMGWATRSVFMNPNSTNLMTKARLTAKMKGDQSKAQDVIMASLETDLNTFPVTWKEWHGAALYAMKQKRNKEALAFANKSVSMNGTMTNMITKSTILETMGKSKDAEKVKKSAIAKGSNAELNNYGYQLLFSGKTNEAVTIFEANSKKNPTDPNVWDSLGEGYMTVGRKKEAIKALKKSLSLNPPPNVKANSMKLLKQMGVDIDGSAKSN